MGGFSAFQNKESYEILNLPGCYAIPGFVDTHIYGAAGADLMDLKQGDIDRMSMALARHGVTTFCRPPSPRQPTG